MIIKLIVCDVEVNQRDNFSNGQLAWRELIDVDGFCAQFGGWHKSTGEAVLIAVWQSFEHIKKFMKSFHDDIFIKSAQLGTYKQCDINYFENILDIPSLNKTTLKQEDSLFSITYCHGVQDIDEFLCNQGTTFKSDMEQIKGMLGSYVLKSLEKSDYFIILSHWASCKSHEDYINNVLPKLKIKNHIKKISTCIIKEENKWEVISSSGYSVLNSKENICQK